MRHYQYLIVGGGIVAGYAAKTFTEWLPIQDGDLAIITSDNSVPYERPPLSKEFLSEGISTVEIHINDPEFYRKHNIKMYLYTRVEGIEPQAKRVQTDHGDLFTYDKLLLATGSYHRRLPFEHDVTERLHYLRGLDDAQSIRDDIGNAESALVIGGGYLGMEAASSLTQAGLQVTLVFPEKRLMEGFFTEELSTLFEEQYRRAGTNLVPEARAIGMQQGKNRDQIHTSLSTGAQLSADLVVVSIGAKPNVALGQSAGLQISEGIVVNETLQTSAPSIYAAGDVANFYDPLFQKRRRVEHWQNAVDMARYAARHMVQPMEENFSTLRYFFSDVFDLSYEFWGETNEADDVVQRIDRDANCAAVWWIREQRLIGAFLMNRTEEERSFVQEWIRTGNAITTDVILTNFSAD